MDSLEHVVKLMKEMQDVSDPELKEDIKVLVNDRILTAIREFKKDRDFEDMRTKLAIKENL